MKLEITVYSQIARTVVLKSYNVYVFNDKKKKNFAVFFFFSIVDLALKFC